MPQSPQQKNLVLWMTGLSGSGKTTLAQEVAARLTILNFPALVLDGDLLRQGLNSDLGFSDEDRLENQRRTAEVAKLLAMAGIIPIVALISPLAEGRELAREIIGADKFVEIYVSCPLETVKKRDVKGLYAKAEAGLIKNFTGIDSAYQPPAQPNIELRTDLLTVSEGTEKIIEFVLARIS